MNRVQLAVNAVMYASQDVVLTSNLEDDELVMSDLQQLIESVYHCLRHNNIESDLFESSFISDNVKGLDTDIQIDSDRLLEINIRASLYEGEYIEDDPYRMKVREYDKDVVWFPAYVQVNNIAIKSDQFNSMWAASSLLDTIIDSAVQSDTAFKEGIVSVGSNKVVLNSTQFNAFATKLIQK